jgi:hypothetical protein
MSTFLKPASVCSSMRVTFLFRILLKFFDINYEEILVYSVACRNV